MEIGRNLGIDTLSAPVDFVVYGEFADEAELARYKAHPTYAASREKVRRKEREQELDEERRRQRELDRDLGWEL